MTRLELATSRPPDVCATNCATSRSLRFVGAKVGHYFVICKFLCTFVLKIDINCNRKDGHKPFPSQKMQAEVILPASKSISNRALIIHALASGGRLEKESFGTVLKNISDCDDTFVMVRALTEMPDTIDIMAAGTAMRFLTAYLSVAPGTHIITGTERMRHRPIGILVNALRQLGAKIEYAGEEGFPPLHITGGRHKGGRLNCPAM